MSKDQLEAAKATMVKWLKHPNELGKEPFKIECAKEFDLYEMHYYIFKFKEKFLDSWKLGVCGGYEKNSLENCGHIYSDYKKYNEGTAIDEATAIIEKIRAYWIAKAHKNEEFERLFKENTKFRTQEEINIEEIDSQFIKSNDIYYLEVGKIDCPSGEIIVADPLAYLPSLQFSPVLDKKFPTGSYSVQVSICKHKDFGIRMCTAKLIINENKVVKYLKASATKDSVIQLKDNSTLEGFPVDAGMICFCDKQVAIEYKQFIDDWYLDNPNGNHYEDYFADIFSKSYEALPNFQREGGDFIEWENPNTSNRMVMIASGFGDGFYNCYYGYDENDKLCEIIVPLINPNLFKI